MQGKIIWIFDPCNSAVTLKLYKHGIIVTVKTLSDLYFKRSVLLGAELNVTMQL